MKNRIPTMLALGCLAAACLNATLAADPAANELEYKTWLSRHASEDLLSRTRYGRRVPRRLVITEFEGDDANTQLGVREFSREATHGTEITMDGKPESFSRDSFADRGGGSDTPLPASTLSRLEELLSALPDDGGRLPPPGADC